MSRSPARARLRRDKEPPEGSASLRLIVAAMVMVSVVAVIAQGATDLFTSLAAITLVPTGYAFSYVQRRRRNVPTKIVLAVGMLAALGGFIQSVGSAQTVDEARVPLASLFLWVQVLHSFDVPRRRDLAFSAVSSLILMAEAGSLSFDTAFMLFVIPWTGLSALWLSWTRTPVRDRVDSPRFVHVLTGRAAAPFAAAARSVLTTGFAGLAAVAVVFLALPRLPGAYVRLPPFEVEDPIRVPAFDGSVVNPSLPAAGGDGVVDFAPNAYPGFGARVDLRARGRLSDRVVMLVRSPQAALWRGQAYDTYDGTGWTTSNRQTVTFGQTEEQSFQIPVEDEAGMTKRVVTTFSVQQPEPNIVFAAYAPVEVFFPAAQLSVDPYGSIRTPILLDEGVVYSVVSNIPVTPPALLRRSPAEWDAKVLDTYTTLPAYTPRRVVALARRITAGARTTHERVMAVQRWLEQHTTYDLDVPRDPPGVDAVDHFLFETRRGFCEHIASAMVVLLRAVGVPARFVTGFGSGRRNPLTGYYEVRESDAHAWVEVKYAQIGWVPYDPTFGVPPADPGAAGWFVAPQVLRSLGAFIVRIVPGPVRSAARALGGAVAAASRGILDAWPVVVPASVALLGLPLVARGRAKRRRHPPPLRAAAAFAQLTQALGSRGHPRAPYVTPSEYLRGLGPVVPADVLEDAGTVVRTFERERFSGDPPSDADVAVALASARRVRSALRDRR